MQSTTCWYQCPRGHVFETAKKTGHHFCQPCQKIHSLKGKQSDAIRLVKIGNRFVPNNSPTVRQQQARNRQSHNKANAKWRSTHPDYFQNHYQQNKQEIRESNDKWIEQHRKEHRDWKSGYNKKYNADPFVKRMKADKMRILRGLAMLGLGESPDKKYRDNKKLRTLLSKLDWSALVCPHCKGKMDIKESGARYCTNKACGYFIPPTQEILSVIRNN